MKHYRVKSLAVLGKSNKKHVVDDVVNENQFEPGHAAKLCEEQHLEFLKEDSEPVLENNGGPELVSNASSSTDKPSYDVDSKTDNTKDDPRYSKATWKKMSEDLTEAGVEFNKDSSKEQLFEIWKDLPVTEDPKKD